jgi:hypothetical protein
MSLSIEAKRKRGSKRYNKKSFMGRGIIFMIRGK